MVLTVPPGNARRRHRSSGGQSANERPHDVSPKPANLTCSRQVTSWISRQGQTGLGLEAQQQVIMDYLNGGKWTLVANFTEVEPGKDADTNRSQLEKALRMCRFHRATRDGC